MLMKNKILSKAYGGVTEARRKLYGLGLPRQWKVITSTLLLLFTFAIGNVWADETYYLQKTDKASGSSPELTGDFYTTAPLSFSVNQAYSEVTYKKGLTLSTNMTSMGSNMKKPDALVRYDCKTNNTEITVVVWNKHSSNSKKLYRYTIQENATIGSANTVSSYSNEGITKNSLEAKTYTVANDTRTSIYFAIEDKSNQSIVQIIATEKGTKFPNPGEVGYQINFNAMRYIAPSGSVGTLDSTSTICGIEMCMNDDGYYSKTAGKLGTNNTNYIKFKVATPVKLNFTTSSTKKYTVSKTKGSTADQITPTANKAEVINLTTAGTYYINPQESSVQPTGLSFSAAPKVTYNANTGGGSMDPSYFTVVANGFTAPSGKMFKEWRTNADGTGTKYDEDDEIESDVTLFAIWEDAVTKYTVTKGTHVNGDFTISPVEQKEGEKVTLAATPEDGYIFSSWSIVKTEGGSATGISVDANSQFVMPAYAVTVNATFVADPCHKYFWFSKAADATTAGVTNNEGSFFTTSASGSNGVTSSITIDGVEYAITNRTGNIGSSDATIVSFTIPADKAGTFYTNMSSSGNSGAASSRTLYLKKGGDTVVIATDAIYGDGAQHNATIENIPSGTYTLHANNNVKVGMFAVKACDATYHTITLDLNGGTGTTSIAALDGVPAYKPADPTKEHADFVKWVVKSTEADYNWSANVTGDLTLKAVWAEWPTLTLAAGEGDGDPIAAQYKAGTEISVPALPGTFSHATKSFTGWAYSQETEVTAGKFAMPATDLTLTAQWQAPSDFDVKFFQGYGDPDVQIGETQSISTGNFAAAPTDPERTGFAFLGWSYDGTEAHIVDVATYGITAETNFRAMWKAVWTVTFDGAGNVNVENGETVASPNSPVMAGKVFQGWYNAEVKYDFSAAVTGNLALTSKWADADANHYYYNYKDDFHFDGVVYKTPEGKVAGAMGSGDVGGDTYSLTTPYTLFSGEEGITSIIATKAIYDSKNNWVNAYLKINNSAESYLTFIIKTGYTAVLKMKMGGYSADPTITLKKGEDVVVATSGEPGGKKASIENNFNEIVYNLVAGTYTMTTATKTLYISHIDLEATALPTYSVTYKAGEGTGDDVEDANTYYAGDEVTLMANPFTAPGGKIWSEWSVKDGNDDDITVTSNKFIMPASNVTVTAQWVVDNGMARLYRSDDTEDANSPYATLAEAVAAAQDGDKIVLQRNVVDGAGIMLTKDDHKTLTIDFGGYTYTAVSPGVGSAGTQNQAFHLEKGNTVTLKNGTITSSGSTIKMLIQNYCDLTLENITLDGTGLEGSHRYVMSNNCGDVVIGDGTTITAKANDVAFDVCATNYYPEGVTVTVKDGATINGIVEYDVWGTKPADNKAELAIEGGTLNITWNVESALAEDAKANLNVSGGAFTEVVPLDYCAEGFIPVTEADPITGKYEVTPGYKVTFIDGSEELEKVAVAAGSAVAKIADPSKAGYDFDAWYTESTLENAWDFATIVPADMSLYAKWVADPCPAPFSLSKVVLTSASDGTVTGYNGNEYAGEKVIGGLKDDGKTADITGDAAVEKGYKLNSGGSSIVFASLKKGEFQAGDRVIVGVIYRNDSRTVDEATTILTIYAGSDKDHTMEVATIKGVSDPGFYTYRLKAADVAAINAAGYKGIGVFRASSNGENHNIYSVELKGCRSFAEMHTLTFKNFDGTATIAAEPLEEGVYASTVAPAAPKITLKRFLGWAEAIDGTPVELTSYTITEDKTLYAVYEDIVCPAKGKVYSLAFDAAATAGEGVEYTVNKNNDDVQIPAAIAAISGGEAYFGTTANADVTILVKDGETEFRRNNSNNYIRLVVECPLQVGDTIAFTSSTTRELNFMKGSVSATSVTSSSQKIIITDTEHALYGAEVIYIKGGNAACSVKTINIIRPAIYDVTFDMMGHGGSAPAAIEDVLEGHKIAAPSPAPTDADYSFGGWYKENTLANEWDFVNDVVTDNITLYAKWVDKSDATLKSLKYGTTEIALEDGVYTYAVNLSPLATSVPALTAVPSNPNATAVVTDAAALDGEGHATSTVVVTPELGGSPQTYTVNFTKLHIYTELADVTETTSWDWNGVATDEVKIDDVAVRGLILANYIDAPNFEKLEGQENARAYRSTTYPAYQGTYLRFHATKPGRLTMNVRNSSGSPKLYVNGGDPIATLTSTRTDYNVIVPAGDVIITSTDGDMRIYNMTYKLLEELTPDYTRPVTEGRYGTICLPNGGIMVGATLYEVAYYGATSEKIFFDEILNGEMVAGVPYIYLPNEGADKLAVFYTDEANESAKSANGLVGYIGASENTSDALAVPAGEGNYILNNNQYREVVSANSAYILSHRAYIHLAYITPSEPALAPGRRRISMSVYSEQVATGIENTGFESEAPRKVLINGELYIIRGEKMYDAKGQLVK